MTLRVERTSGFLVRTIAFDDSAVFLAALRLLGRPRKATYSVILLQSSRRDRFVCSAVNVFKLPRSETARLHRQRGSRPRDTYVHTPYMRAIRNSLAGAALPLPVLVSFSGCDCSVLCMTATSRYLVGKQADRHHGPECQEGGGSRPAPHPRLAPESAVPGQPVKPFACRML